MEFKEAFIKKVAATIAETVSLDVKLAQSWFAVLVGVIEPDTMMELSERLSLHESYRGALGTYIKESKNEEAVMGINAAEWLEARRGQTEEK